MNADTILLIEVLRDFAKLPSNATAWLIRTRHDRWEITFDRGVRASAKWWISRSVLAELLWDRDVAHPLPDALNDRDEAAKIAVYVRGYKPPALQRLAARLRVVPPV